MNEGLGEGVAYRGRLLLSLRVEVIEGPPILVPGVTLEPALPLPEASLGPPAEFLLFGVITDVTMLDKRLVDKPLHLEVSIGCVGDGREGQGEEVGGEEWGGGHAFAAPSPVQSLTVPIKAQLDDEHYCHLPFGDSKPCLYVAFKFADIRWRLFHANHLGAIAALLRSRLPLPRCRLKGRRLRLDVGRSGLVELAPGSTGGALKLQSLLESFLSATL